MANIPPGWTLKQVFLKVPSYDHYFFSSTLIIYQKTYIPVQNFLRMILLIFRLELTKLFQTLIWNDCSKKINDWAYKRKISFNPDSTKPPMKLSSVEKKIHHSPVFFNDLPVKRVQSHRHLGLTFRSINNVFPQLYLLLINWLLRFENYKLFYQGIPF